MYQMQIVKCVFAKISILANINFVSKNNFNANESFKNDAMMLTWEILTRNLK